MFRRGRPTWSPVEEQYLRDNLEVPVNQLTIALAKSRNAIKQKLDEFAGKPQKKTFAKRSRIGKRQDLVTETFNGFFRSNWEANIARWLNYQKKKWTYEPEVFLFKEVKHGTTSYCPDFKVGDHWIEVKGYIDTKGKTAIRRFKKYYPEEFKKLQAIVGSANTAAAKFFESEGIPIIGYISTINKEFKNIIPNWE